MQFDFKYPRLTEVKTLYAMSDAITGRTPADLAEANGLENEAGEIISHVAERIPATHDELFERLAFGIFLSDGSECSRVLSTAFQELHDNGPSVRLKALLHFASECDAVIDNPELLLLIDNALLCVEEVVIHAHRIDKH